MYSNSCGIVCVAKRQISKAAPCGKEKEQMKTITEITRQKPTPPQIRLAAYCRVSSDSSDQLHSFAAQIKYYSEYCKRHPEYKFVDIYADEGITGTSMEKRDDFRRMLRDCKKGLIDRIIVKSMSRFARNTEEMLTALRALEQMEVSVYFEEQGLDTKSMNSEMFATFPGMVAQQESVSISQNMRWSYKKRMESGEFNCCAPAYGFDLINGKLVINETEAAVIRRIFDLYLQGVGMQTIANILNNEGVRRQYGREKWHHTTVNYVLNNERYKGDALLQKQITTQTLPFKKQRNHGEQPMYYVENSNPAIVSRETYEAVQALIKSRQPSCKRKAKTYPLTRTLLCPDCGHTFRRQVVNGTAYWLCAAKATNKTDCAWRRVKEDEVYAAFNLMIRKVQANREYLLGTLIRQLEELQYRTTGSQQRIKEIDREIADLTAQNLVLTRLHGKGVLNAADYTAQSDVLENKITELRIERRAKITDSDENEMLEELKMLNDILKEVEIGIDFDAELFEQTVDSITVDSNELLTFHLAGGISLPEKIREKGRCYQA
jgi:resolvase, n-terminal:recombinase, putative